MFRANRSLIALLGSSFLSATAQAQQESSWYVIRMAGSPAGWMHETRTRSDSGFLVATTMRLVLNRLGSSVVMEMSASSLETTSGAFVRSDGTMRLSDQLTEIHATTTGDSVRLRTRAGGRDFERLVAARRAPLGPAAADRLTADALRGISDSVTYGSFDPTAGAPAVVTRVLQSIDTIVVGARRTIVRRVLERSTASPVQVTYWIDTSGTTLRSAYDSPFGRTESDLVDSTTALRANAGARLSDEQYARTLVLTRVRLPQARRMAKLRLALTSKDTTLRWPELNDVGQVVISREPSRLVLEIARQAPPMGVHRFPVALTLATREYLEPNAYIQSDQLALHALALRIIGSETDAWRAALALERWVADSMHFDLGVTFAPSVEVFEQRRGTCVAYATLLAALARTLGIPSRIAFGFAYVNGILGGHAWTEVLIGNSWLGIDGALVPNGAADAARFAFVHVSLAGGPAEMTSSEGSQLYGRIDAQVLAYQVEGDRPVTLRADAEAYRLQGDTYVNSTLGVQLRKPFGFRFIELDETWPKMTIVAVVDAKGDTVRVSSVYRDPWIDAATAARSRAISGAAGATALTHIAGRAAWIGVQEDRDVLAVPNGGETVVLESRGPAAHRILMQVASGLTFHQH